MLPVQSIGARRKTRDWESHPSPRHCIRESIIGKASPSVKNKVARAVMDILWSEERAILDGSRERVPIAKSQQVRKAMKKVEIKDAQPYAAAKHFNMTALRLHGKEESGARKFWMGLSHFLPQGGAEYDASPTEKIYFVLEGEVTVVTSEKEKVVLKAWDSIHIAPNEGRAIRNETNKPASMLVIVTYPDA